MKSNELKLQARLLFRKTLFNYYEDLERIYLIDFEDEKVEDFAEISEIHRRAREKLKLIDVAAKRYGLEGFNVPYFVDKIGNIS